MILPGQRIREYRRLIAVGQFRLSLNSEDKNNMRALVLAAFLIAAATSAVVVDARQNTQWRTERRVIGDTQIVRTVGAPASAGLRHLTKVLSFGSADGADEYIFGNIAELARGPDGSLWVFDAQVPVLRKYDSTGRFMRSVGRSGAGPGEYSLANGLVVLKTGPAILWDRGTQRLRVYSLAGTHVADWALPDLFGSPGGTNGLRFDTAGFFYTPGSIGEAASGNPSMPGSGRRAALLRHNSAGQVVDTMFWPTVGFRPPPMLEARRTTGNNTSSSYASVPFSPSGFSDWSPLGYFATGRSDQYAINVLQSNGRVLRIERDVVRVRLTAAQRQDAIDDIEKRLRSLDPAWQYNGAPVPQELPYYNAFDFDHDGRLWVRVSVPLRLQTQAERDASAAPLPARSNAGASRSGSGGSGGGAPGASSPLGAGSTRNYVGDIVYDVFAADGRFLGRVPYPGRILPRVRTGDYIWGVTTDSLGVQSVSKFRIEPPLGR